MATQIEAIYSVLAAMTVTVQNDDDVTYTTVSARDLDNLKNSISDGDCPVRLLLPLGTRAEARSIVPVTLNGGVATLQWRITDLLLWKPSGIGGGLQQYAVPLVRYMAGYFNAMQQLGFKLGRNAMVENCTFDPGVIGWPQGSTQSYFGVEVTVFVKELA